MTSLLEDKLIKTTSIERVVAPLSIHLCHLILLCESGEDTEQFTQLETAARAVSKASKNMATVASKLVADSDDDLMKMEMGPLVESLTVSGQHVLLATQKLAIEPAVIEHREELIVATQNVLLGVVKILLVEDDATLRKIIAGAQWLLDSLSKVAAAADIPSLLKAFHVYSRAMLHFHTLALGRMQDLRDKRQREIVSNCLETLKKCVSMLHTAMSTTIKHPTSEEAQDAKRYILNQVDVTVNEIITALKSNFHWTPSGPSGYYTEKRNCLLKLLSDSGALSIKDSHFDVVIRDLVFHCMAVANTSRIQPEVTYFCSLVLRHWTMISQQIKCSTDKFSSNEQLENLCASLMRQIHKLDEVIVRAALYQFLDTFVMASAPLEQLINTVNSILESEIEGECDLDSLQPFTTAFIAQADKTVQVAGFISALAIDEKSLESVENSKVCLMHIKDGVTPLLLELEGDSVQCCGALQKLIDLHQRWIQETEQLLNGFSDVINVKEFTSLAVQEMEKNWKKIHEAFKEGDYVVFRDNAGFLIGYMSQVIHVVRRYIDKSDDPLYRNGLLVLVRQAEASAAEVTGFVTEVNSEANLNTDIFLSLSHSVSTAIKSFDILLEGLDGLQHPHLLSPLREEVRQPVISSSGITGMKPQQSADYNGDGELLVQVKEPENVFIQKETESLDKATELEDKAFVVHQVDNIESREPVFIMDSVLPKNLPLTQKPPNTEASLTQKPQHNNLLPLLCEVVTMTKGKDVEALNMACTGVLELSNCYALAAKEAAMIIDVTENREVETLRSELVALTPLLLQTAQETAMSTAMNTDGVYKHSTQFSDIILNTRKILLPVAGIWYHAIHAMFQSSAPTAAETSTKELTEVMCLCADVVQIVTSLDIKVIGDSHESISALHSKLKKAQTNTKHLTDLVSSKLPKTDELEGPCILWALSIQVLLNSLDKILGIATPGTTGQLIRNQLTPQKWLAAMSENSLRIQEAARLSSLNCRDSYKVKLLNELQEEVKTLTEAYLQAAEDFGAVSLSSVLLLARSEFIQRQLQGKMKALSGLLGKVNEEYVTSIQHIVQLAHFASTNGENDKAEEMQFNFEKTTELILGNVQAATECVQDCFNFIRDPRERSNLRFINDHLMFQMSDIVSRARLMVETKSICEMLSLEIQTQYWAAKAHYLVAEICKVDGILQETKERVKHGLQGHKDTDISHTPTQVSSAQKEETYPSNMRTNYWSSNNPSITKTTKPSKVLQVPPQQETKMGLQAHRSERAPVFSTGTSSLTYTSLFLKRETERWDIQGNQIVKVTKEMADKIYHMAQYLKRKGPIQSKDAFVNSAKDLVSNCQTITQFVRVIADHCLDQNCTEELSVIAEQILTITNQLSIISSVNAVTPGSKSSDEILVKNAQNLMQTVIQGVRAAETACIRGLKQPEPNSEAAKAATLCFQWKKNLLLHRAQQQLNPETDDLGLRKTSLHPAAPSLAPHVNMLETYK